MGASEVVGIDNDLSKPATEFLIPFLNSKVKMLELNVYDLKPEIHGYFDVIIFPGVLYHLRYPFWALKVVKDVLADGGKLIIETAFWKCENSRALLFCPTQNDSPYESTSCTFFNEKGLVDTLESIGFKTDSIEYVKKDWLTPIRDIVKRIIYRQGAIGRGVFVTTLSRSNVDPFAMTYWEKTHDEHTNHGG